MKAVKRIPSMRVNDEVQNNTRKQQNFLAHTSNTTTTTTTTTTITSDCRAWRLRGRKRREEMEGKEEREV